VIDADECLVNNGFCDDICINDVGSYRCACADGYELTKNLHTCRVKPQVISTEIIIIVFAVYGTLLFSLIIGLFVVVHQLRKKSGDSVPPLTNAGITGGNVPPPPAPDPAPTISRHYEDLRDIQPDTNQTEIKLPETSLGH
jgi:hypothetical protein